MERRTIIAASSIAVLAAAAALAAEPGPQKPRPLPHEYGRVVFRPGPGGKLPGVVFDHWLHRVAFTCRVCHVDVGFALRAGGTGVKEEDIEAGYYCGACHDGKRPYQGRPIFAACAKGPAKETCRRCHSLGQKVKLEVDFAAVTRNLPRGRLGNGVDWVAADAQGLIHPAEELAGITIPRKPIVAQDDFLLNPKVAAMPDVVFSHRKHNGWIGCEGCHPDLFTAKRGASGVAMAGIHERKYCGVCHSTVAFPVADCERCHVKPVR
jgi:c(7)-type cytochrome triheme protein